MKVTNIIPVAKVKEYVDRILVIENNKMTSPFILPLYANGVPTLLFKSSKGTIGNKGYGHFTLFGQTITPENLTLKNDFTLIAYFFKPYSLLSLFGIAANEITDQPIDINLLKPQVTIELEEKLLNCELLSDQLELLNAYIFKLISIAKKEPVIIKQATSIISEQLTKETLVLAQRELHITERTFQRLFEKQIGIAPNVYRRICQFNAAFTQLNLGKYNSLTEIAFQNGYADQSHYIRAFKDFTNITPTDYLNFSTQAPS